MKSTPDHPFRSRFLWELYASYAFLVVVTTVVIGVLIHSQLERSLLTDFENSLKEKTELLVPLAERALSSGGTLVNQEEVVRMGLESKTRITVIDKDGKVLADSEADPTTMENHLQRREIQESREKPYGMYSRSSWTTRDETRYVARAVRKGDSLLGFARVAITLEQVKSRLATMRMILLAGAALGILVALFMGLLVARKTTSPVLEMTEIAEAIRRGHYEQRVSNLPNDEFGILGDTLNRLCVELMERRAASSRERAELRAILSGMVEGVLAVNWVDEVIFCNQAACDLLGSTEISSAGVKITEHLRVMDLFGLLARARTQESLATGEINLNRDGRDLVLEASATPFRGGDTKGVVVVLHDITELRRLERVRRDFVANVSHELKTPLTTIKGYVETLLSGALEDSENNVRFLNKIEEHVERLNNLVRDLLRLARIESDAGVDMPGSCDCVPLLEATAENYESLVREKSLNLEVSTPSEPVTVRGAVDGVSQIMENLLDNAVKYTPSGGRIALRLYREDRRACIEVEDTGIGIPREDLDRVFERFYRVDKGRSREAGGTGLGLSIVKHLVQALQGEVQVESELGKGSRFRVCLPVVW